MLSNSCRCLMESKQRNAMFIPRYHSSAIILYLQSFKFGLGEEVRGRHVVSTSCQEYFSHWHTHWLLRCTSTVNLLHGILKFLMRARKPAIMSKKVKGNLAGHLFVDILENTGIHCFITHQCIVNFSAGSYWTTLFRAPSAAAVTPPAHHAPEEELDGVSLHHVRLAISSLYFLSINIFVFSLLLQSPTAGVTILCWDLWSLWSSLTAAADSEV